MSLWFPPARAAEVADLAHTHWGAPYAEVAKALGASARVLDPPIDYGVAKARLFVKALPVGDVTMNAFYQFDAEGRLEQVLLERRDAGSTPKAFAAIDRALNAALGKPATTCDRQYGTPRVTERRWRAGATEVHLAFMDFTGAAMTLNPNKDFLNPLLPSTEYEQFKRRAFPRRIVLRYFPAANAALKGVPACE